jgi:hypothetical protein
VIRISDRTAIIAVVAVALAASLAGLANAFVYDDVIMIQLNERVRGLSHWRQLLTSPYWPPPWNQEHYRPLTSLLFAAQYGLGAGFPLIFRITSYLLYAGAAAGVFLLGARLLPRHIALGAALLFAAHPVHVEAVAPAVGQSELVVGIVAIVMTILYLDRRRAGPLALRDWGVLGVLYALASLSKEHGLVLPALLLAVEAFLIPGPFLSRVRHLWAGYAGLAAIGAGLVLLRFAVLGGQFSGQWTTEALNGLSMPERALTMLQVVPHWARLLVWPASLQVEYSPQEFMAATGIGTAEVLGVVALAAWVAGIVLARRRLPVLSFGLAWMAIILLPVSNVLIPTGSLLAERLLYLPSVGFLLGLGAVLAAMLERPAWSTERRIKVIGGVCALLVLAGTIRSAERHRVWRNEAVFSVRGVQDAPRSFRAQRAYGNVLFDLGFRDLALQTYSKAIELAAPTGHAWRVRNDLAARFRASGETEAESEQLLASLEENPDQEDTRGHLVAAYLALGKYAEAGQAADSALARGGAGPVFSGLRALADSAARASAPPGSVRIRVTTGAARAPGS